jgi:hypothetical protein
VVTRSSHGSGRAAVKTPTELRHDRAGLFTKLENPREQTQFWERVADDVDRTVEGTHQSAGRYHSKAAFPSATFDRLAGVLVDGVRLEVQRLYSTVTPPSWSCSRLLERTRERPSRTATAGYAALRGI